jgi:hypothetical protein
MTAAQKGQKIIDACAAAQSGGSPVRGIGGPDGLMTWTGMSHSQVWAGLNWLRDQATKLGGDLVACRLEAGTFGTRTYRVGDEVTCRQWAMDRMKYIATAARRAEEMMAAVAQVTGRLEDVNAAGQLDRMVTETDRAISALLAAA